MNTFEKFLDGQTLDIRNPQYVEEANTEMARFRNLCWEINQTDPADRDRIVELEHGLVPDMGEGAVVDTGSVVTKDVPAHTIVVGNPAHVIRTIE